MRTLWPILFLLVFVVACESPVEPTNIGDSPLTITNIINIGGDDDHSGNGKPDPDDDDDVSQNSPPVLLLPPTVVSDVGDSVSVDIQASDPDGDAVSIGWDPQTGPRDCTISGTGPTSTRISCVISSSSPADSPYTVRVTGDDGNGGVTVGFFNWIVNAPV